MYAESNFIQTICSSINYLVNLVILSKNRSKNKNIVILESKPPANYNKFLIKDSSAYE